MHAIQIIKPGEIEYITSPIPTLKPGEALVQVKACAVNYLDLHVYKGRMNIPFPHTPGSDIAGVITHIEGKSTFTVGEEVVINPAITCQVCTRCKKNLPCPNVAILGYKTPGGYAEYVIVPISQLYLKPKHLSFVEAASFPLTFLTAWHMLAGRAQLKKDETVFIWGASGGLGSAAIQIAKYIGATVIASVSSQADAKQIKKLGADEVIIYTQGNVKKKVEKITKQEMIDVVFESVGAKTWDISLSLLHPYGRIVIAGTTSGNEVKLNLYQLYRNQYSLLGASMGTREEFEIVLSLFEKGKLHPLVDSVFPLRKAQEALKKMEESKQTGKIVLEIK